MIVAAFSSGPLPLFCAVPCGAPGKGGNDANGAAALIT